jgi:GntR family transcriptional regulator of bglA
MAKYEEVAGDLVRYIHDHELEADDKLPSIQEMVDYYKVSKNTVLSALNDLERQGLIYQVRGSGVYVRGNTRKGYINLLNIGGFNSTLSQFKIESKILTLELVEPNAEAVENLKIEHPDKTKVYHVVRIRYIEGRPFGIEESYFDKDIIPYLSEDIASASIFDYITEDLEIPIGYGDHFLRVGKLKADEAEHLHLNVGDPTLRAESIFHLHNGKPFDYSKITYHYEETQFFIQGTNYQYRY